MPAAGEQRARRFPLALAGIVAAGVAVRVLYTLLVAPYPPRVLDDQFYYSAGAHLLAGGHGFISPFGFFQAHDVEPTATHPPLYTLVLAGMDKVGLGSADAERLSGAVFGAGTIAVVALVARRLAGNRAALVAAGVAAVYPALVTADGALMSESLFGLFVALVLLAALRFADAPARSRALALGGLGGLATLTHSQGLVLFILLLLVLARGPRRRLLLWAALAFAVVLAPWEARCVLTFHRPVVLSTDSGTVVGGANCHAPYYGPHVGGWSGACLRDTSKNEAVDHERQLRAGLDYARAHASRLPVVLVARLGRTWDLYDPSTPPGRSVTVGRAGLPVLYILLVLGAVGVVVLRRRGRPIGILLTTFAAVSLTSVLTWGSPRFREPADVALAVLAGVAITALAERRTAARRAQSGRTGTPAPASAALAAPTVCSP